MGKQIKKYVRPSSKKDNQAREAKAVRKLAQEGATRFERNVIYHKNKATEAKEQMKKAKRDCLNQFEMNKLLRKYMYHLEKQSSVKMLIGRITAWANALNPNKAAA